MALHLNKLEPPSLKDAFFQVWLKLTQWLLYRRSIYVSYRASVAATSNDKKHSFIQEKYFDILNTLQSTHKGFKQLSEKLIGYFQFINLF